MNRHNDSSYGVALYREVMAPPVWVWLLFIFLFGSMSLAVWAAVGVLPTIIVSVVEVLLMVLMARGFILRVTVTKGWLLVGKAAIERAYIHDFQVLDSGQTRLKRGVDADAAAYLAIRFWVPGSIFIKIRDARDATPYWLVSTKKGTELAKLLTNPVH
jgi:signal transduction histidine kinase